MPTRKILIALTSHGELGSTGRSTGFYLPEVAHPWKVFTDASYTVDLVSVQGGRPPTDGIDRSDPVQQAFLDDPGMSVKLANTLRPDQVTPTEYDAIFYAGGHGVMWDFPGATRLAEIARDVYENDGVVAAVCHGPAGLVNITLSDGRYLVDGKEVAAFTNDEEATAGLAEEVPFLLQTRLEQRGAKHTGAPNFQPWIVRDGRLVTGQNPASSTGVAEQVLTALNDGAGAGA
jgi:putative intracellular protease/amidase